MDFPSAGFAAIATIFTSSRAQSVYYVVLRVSRGETQRDEEQRHRRARNSITIKVTVLILIVEPPCPLDGAERVRIVHPLAEDAAVPGVST